MSIPYVNVIYNTTELDQYGYVEHKTMSNTNLPFMQKLSPDYMSNNPDGVPDLPSLGGPYPELECLACSTSVYNTNKENNCVKASSTKTTMCKSLSW